MDFDEILDIVFEREETLQFVGAFVVTVLVGMGIDYLYFEGSAGRGIFTIFFIATFMIVLFLLIARDKKDAVTAKSFLSQAIVTKAIQDSQQAIKERDEAVNTLSTLQGDANKLRSNLEADRQALASVRSKYTTCKEELDKCVAELDKCQDKLRQVLDDASHLTQELKASTESNNALADQVSQLQEQVQASEGEALAKWQDERQKLLDKCQKLSPYYEFYKQFEAYKGAESVTRSSKSSVEDKKDAKVAFEKAKDEMLAFYNEQLGNG